MDLFGMDRKLSEFGDEFSDLLDQDVFTPPPTNPNVMDCLDLDTTLDQNWFENFFDDPVLNDRMISDAIQQPQHVQSEHSYSLANDNGELIPGTTIKAEPMDKEDQELIGTMNPNTMQPDPVTETETKLATSLLTGMMTTTTALPPVQPRQESLIKHEPLDTEMTTVTVTRTTTPHVQQQPTTILKQPTIILATGSGMQSGLQQVGQVRQERLVLPKVNIKVEPYDTASTVSSLPSPDNNSHDSGMYDSSSLPPTPPSSNSSDSEGGLSPQRSAPPSPVRQTPLMRQQQALRSTSYSYTQPIFSSTISHNGVLMLSEEERRTLVTEGYPIPAKLPLTKQEEKNLKKVRRKIKNKISAQESRRKKKEYLETLEKRVEAFSQENTDLKRKVDSLENNNRTLMSQLQKLQVLVGKIPRPSSATSTQTGTCLMVLALFFAVFLGTWSPMSWSIGYSSIGASVPSVPVTQFSSPHHMSSVHESASVMGPKVEDPYSTPNVRSRLLQSIAEEEEDASTAFGPHTPFSYKDIINKLFSLGQSNMPSKQAMPVGFDEQDDDVVIMEGCSVNDAPHSMEVEPPIPKVSMLDVESENNQTGDEKQKAQTAADPMHPDIAANIAASVISKQEVKST